MRFITDQKGSTYKIPRHPTRVLSERNEQQGKNSGSLTKDISKTSGTDLSLLTYVPASRSPGQPWKVVLTDTKILFHVRVPSAIRARWQTRENGTVPSSQRALSQMSHSHEACRDSNQPFVTPRPVEPAPTVNHGISCKGVN